MPLAWGEQDLTVPPVYAEEFSSRLGHATTVILPRCGHLPMLKQPEEFGYRAKGVDNGTLGSSGRDYEGTA